MRLFSARFDINSYEEIGNGIYKVGANVVDNTGMYLSTDVAIGDIVYVSGLIFGNDLFRYQVSKIESAEGANLKAELTWDVPFVNMEPIVPAGEAIIGARHLHSMTSNIVDFTVNNANEKLIADARNYQQALTNANIMLNSSLTSDKAFVYEQESPSNCWVVTHNLRKYPSVSVVDEEGRLVICEIQYIDVNQVVISFSISFTGKAYLN